MAMPQLLETEIQPGHEPPAYPTRPAVGATATLFLPGAQASGTASPRLVSQVDGGGGHSGKRGSEVHFGLGQVKNGERLRVELRWRDGEGRVTDTGTGLRLQ